MTASYWNTLAGLVVALWHGCPAHGASEATAAAPSRLRPFRPEQVHVLDGPFRLAFERNRRFLASLDPDRQLHTFRLTAGLPTTAKPLGGWEAPEHGGRGEFFGHSLSARALVFAAIGDQRLKNQLDYLVAELGKCQDALGTNGYLHAEPESVFDRLEAGENVEGIYYTVHKLLAGLLDVYECCGNRQALEIAEKLAHWVHYRSGRLSPERRQKILDVEFGGLNEALYSLYAITMKAEHLETARRFDHEKIYRPLAEGRDQLQGLHANTTIPKIIGAARAYEVTGDPRFRQIAECFWNQVVRGRCYATGGTSNYEHWRTAPGRLAAELSDCTQECCCTYNMLKLTRHIFAWTGRAEAADYYERALFDGVLGTLDPETGLTMYYVPLAGGYYKTFASPEDSFWCCTGTGVESFASLANAIYFQEDDGLRVNLFIASELSWPDKGLVLRQETQFPEQARTLLRLKLAQSFELALRVRVPYWATGGATFKLNGAPLVLAAAPSSYAEVRRVWRDGDRLEIEMPMGLHLESVPDNPNLAALLYGPLVLAGRLGELSAQERHNHNPSPGGFPSSVPEFVTDSDDLAAWIQRVPGKSLEFRTQGQDTNVVLQPLCFLFNQRYAVYWSILRRGSPTQVARLAERNQEANLLARTVDAVDIGDPKSEADHALTGSATAAGLGNARRWRHATGGGWFSYRLKVLPDGPMTLRCTFWGDEDPPRLFDIVVDGTRIATMELNHNKPGEFFAVEHPLPTALTRGKQQVTVQLRAHAGNVAGGLFGIIMLRSVD